MLVEICLRFAVAPVPSVAQEPALGGLDQHAMRDLVADFEQVDDGEVVGLVLLAPKDRQPHFLHRSVAAACCEADGGGGAACWGVWAHTDAEQMTRAANAQPNARRPISARCVVCRQSMDTSHADCDFSEFPGIRQFPGPRAPLRVRSYGVARTTIARLATSAVEATAVMRLGRTDYRS